MTAVVEVHGLERVFGANRAGNGMTFHVKLDDQALNRLIVACRRLK